MALPKCSKCGAPAGIARRVEGIRQQSKTEFKPVGGMKWFCAAHAPAPIIEVKKVDGVDVHKYNKLVQ